MTKQEFMVFWNGEDWITYGEVSTGIYEEVVDFSKYDELAGGSRWSLSHKAKNQRKWRNNGCMTLSIYAMLDLVKEKLNNGEKAFCQTPDIVVHFRAI